MEGKVSIVFSDLDGTLVHYPKDFGAYADIASSSDGHVVVRYRDSGEERQCRVLESMTGGLAYLSERSVTLIDEIRSAGGIFVLITGARSSTYASRRAKLPVVDYEVFENGGRCIQNNKIDMAWTDRFADMIGETKETEIFPKTIPPVNERTGHLWELYRRLQSEGGWKLDDRNYVTNFRIDINASEGRSLEDFERLRVELPAMGLATSFNLGKADIYPASSGKANAAQRILDTLNIDRSDSISMFDDDNDLELGALTGRALLPGITHESVLKAMEKNPQWKLMDKRGFLGTEQALEQILALVPKKTEPQPVTA